jgi:hypothetical protein
MKKNMGVIDRILRTFLAVVVAVLYLGGGITGIAAVLLGIFAVIFLATSFTGVCPVYKLLGISTLEKGDEHYDEYHHHGAAHQH